MANPDTSSLSSLSIAFPTSVVLFILIIAFFQFKTAFPSFYLILWIAIPVVSYVISVIIYLVSQYITCNTIHAKKAFMGGISSLVTACIALGISSISLFRIPVASVFAPLFEGDQVDVTISSSSTDGLPVQNSNKGCCTPRRSLEGLEASFPLLEGMSYGFYSFFGMMFGIVIGSGSAIVCE